MGRISSGRGNVGDGNLFGDLAISREKKSPFLLETSGRGLTSAPKPPDQTNSKSKLIAEYISNFQQITKGGLFIDGFAAPQSRGHEDACSAARVLAIQPARLRTFWLCHLEAEGIAQLKRLKAQHHLKPRWRRVFVMEGDFNQSVDFILASGDHAEVPHLRVHGPAQHGVPLGDCPKARPVSDEAEDRTDVFPWHRLVMRSIKSSTTDAKLQQINRGGAATGGTSFMG